MAQLTNAAFIEARPGMGEMVGRKLLTLVEPTRREPGCIAYDIHQMVGDADAWFIYEIWRSGEDFEAHMQTRYVREFLDDLPGMAAGEVQILPYRMRSALAER